MNITLASKLVQCLQKLIKCLWKLAVPKEHAFETISVYEGLCDLAYESSPFRAIQCSEKLYCASYSWATLKRLMVFRYSCALCWKYSLLGRAVRYSYTLRWEYSLLGRAVRYSFTLRWEYSLLDRAEMLASNSATRLTPKWLTTWVMTDVMLTFKSYVSKKRYIHGESVKTDWITEKLKTSENFIM